MLVQLSPFKTVKTLLKIPSGSRRRKRNETDSFDISADVSFVTTSSRRGQLKWKQHSPEVIDSQPLLLVSSDHEISIIGRSKEHSYDEFSSLRYSSRPGNAGSFAPSGKGADKLPRIPPILDAKNDMMYALQNGNSRLCCWDALTVQGPDETRASKVDLPKPAVSMELLPLHKGAIYGTCVDGSIFIARLDRNIDGPDELVIEYLPNKLTKGKHTHVGTIAELPQGAMRGGSRKRKLSDADGHTTVYFYQTFHDDHALNLVRHEVVFERYSSVGGKMITENSLEQRVVNIALGLDVGHCVLEAQMMISSPGNELNACVAYRVQSGEDAIRKSFSVLFSLTTGQLTHNRVELPAGTRQCSLIGDSLLVIGTEKDLQVFDIETGSVLYTTSLPHDLRSRPEWQMRANSKIGAVALLYEERDTICLALSSLMLDDVYTTLAKTKLSLASKLTSAGICAHTPDQTRPMAVMYNALNLQISDDSGKRSLEQTVYNAVKVLDEARMSILSPSSVNLENYLFMDTYESSVATVLEAVKSVVSLSDGSPRNPQDDDSEGTGKNGDATSIATKKAKNGLNGVYSPIPHTKALTPSVLPQAFIDGATHSVLKLLQCGKVDDDVVGRRVSLARLDARIILHQLLNTGKLSARFHFDNPESIQRLEEEHQMTSVLRSLKLSNKRGRRCFSPVDMIMTMLRRCPDVSERQMVVMLSYTMRRALPEDIAEMFMDERKHYLHTQYADLARSFFSLRSNLNKSRKDNETVKSAELDRLGRKLILAGTTYVLYGIVGYSQCNEAMLRVAIQDVMEKSEAIILARCLSKIFGSNKKDLVSKAPPSVNAVKALCQWAAALCDTFHDELATAPARKIGEISCLAALLEAINLAIRQSQEIISLKEDVRRVESEIQHQIDAKDQLFDRALPNPEDLPGYSIAKLVF